MSKEGKRGRGEVRKRGRWEDKKIPNAKSQNTNYKQKKRPGDKF
jgi:hypothetical protein